MELRGTCRCCLQKCSQLTNMLEDCLCSAEKSKKTIIHEYLACSGIPQKNVTPSTAYICKTCRAKLKIAYEFRRMCRKSERYFSEHTKLDSLANTKIEPGVHDEPVACEVVYVKTEFSENDQELTGGYSEAEIVDATVSEFKPYMCEVLPRSFENHTNLLTHSQIHRESIPPADEFQSFDSKQAVKSTFNYQHDSDKYRCPDCGLTFFEFLELHTHFKGVHDPANVKKLFPCFKCKKIHKNRRFILNHSCEAGAVRKMTNNKIDDKIHKCEKCGKHFISDDALVCHRFTICMDDPQFICLTCGKEFLDQNRLTAHKRLHKAALCICDVCGYTAVKSDVMKRHKISHQTERIAKCQLCLASFKSFQNLAKHQSIHQEKKYECAHCGTKFKALHNLKHHILASHLGYDGVKTNFACDICQKKFGNRRCLEQHIRGHTGELVKCKVCNKEFKHISGLRNHVRSMHEGRVVACVYCNQTFSSTARLKEHLFLHRGFSPYNCDNCPQKFVRKYRYVNHLKTHNIEYKEEIHGYRETEDIDALIAGKSGLSIPAATDQKPDIEFQSVATENLIH